jgi:hypothetical protein
VIPLLLALAAPAPCPVTFTDVARSAGIDFRHERGATKERRLPETMGSGLAWLDYDGDGWMDLYVVQSGTLDAKAAPQPHDRLYRNNHDGTFTDVTKKAGIGNVHYGMGAAAADYDNDGWTDIYVTNFGANILYHNNGDGTFTDVTKRAGVAASGWSTSAAWGDVDGDGNLDLFVTRYVDYSVDKDYFCGNVETGQREYCHPTLYPGESGILFHNNGDGTFTDITGSAGVGAIGKGLGVAFVDVDQDGRPDIYVANDTTINFLFHNLGGGRFEDLSLISGAGFDPEGKPEGGMGVDTGDVDGDGLPDILVANFDAEMNSFYRNLGSGIFEDVSIGSGFGSPGFNFSGFGLNLVDVDDDGALDVYIANGHVQEHPKRQGVTWAERDFLLWNDGKGGFRERGCGPAFGNAYAGRGSAAADYDNDGDPDIAVSNSGGPLQILRNDGRHGRWAGVRLRGSRSNREGIGARLVAELTSGKRLTRWVEAGGSYLSSSDPRVLFGLGPDGSIAKLTVDWPSGAVQEVRSVPEGVYTEVREPVGEGKTAALAPAEALASVPEPKPPSRAEVRAEFEKLCDHIHASDDEYYGTAAADRLAAQLRDAVGDSGQTLRLRVLLSIEKLRLGETTAAVDLLEKARETVIEKNLPAIYRDDATRRLALANLRLGEHTNCVGMHSPASCILPIRGEGVHRDKTGARAAEKLYIEYLRGHPDDPTVRWLLNVAAMTAGDYPDGVPERFRISPETFTSEGSIGRFPDVAGRAGVDALDSSGGAIVDDFDGDGLLDVVTSTIDPCGAMHFFHNEGNGRFEDRSEASGLSSQLGGLNIIQTDYDNDGRPDILVLRGGWMGENGRMRNSLLHNDGGGRFTDVTEAAGLASPAYPTQTAAWADFDGDGLLDVYIGNESSPQRGRDYPSQLFHNNGDGTFTDIAARAGVTNDRFAKAVVAGDYDNDGRPDIFVSNIGPNRLYHNNGDGTFTDVAEKLGVVEPADRSFTAWFFDYDNDGWLDIFVGDYGATVDDVAASYEGLPHGDFHPRLYHNDHGTGFTDVSRKMGLDRPSLPMGGNFGDLDNDGWPDFYLGTGLPDYESVPQHRGPALRGRDLLGGIRQHPERARRGVRRPRQRRRRRRVRANGRSLPGRRLSERPLRESGTPGPLDHSGAGGEKGESAGNRRAGARPRVRPGRRPRHLRRCRKRRLLRRKSAGAAYRPRGRP